MVAIIMTDHHDVWVNYTLNELLLYPAIPVYKQNWHLAMRQAAHAVSCNSSSNLQHLPSSPCNCILDNYVCLLDSFDSWPRVSAPKTAEPHATFG